MNPILILLIGAIVILILIAIGVYISSTSERTLIEERLGRYLEEDKSTAREREREASTALTEWVNKRVEKSSFGDQIAKNLARADMKFKAGEFIFFIFILASVLGGAAYIFGGENPAGKLFSMAIGVSVGIAAPIIYMRSQQAKRLRKFNDQLPDMLNLMVNGLRAGYSTMQAMEAVSKEMPPPISEEFRRVVQEMQLGIPMDRALDNLVRRIPSEDLDFVVTAINVQREVGGPLAEILDTIAFTIRERIRIKGEIRVMTSQVVMSGRILSAVPFVVFVILWFINQEYMGEFFKNAVCGGIALVVGMIMIAVGYFVMMKIADIEV
ncbi:MAG: type II secretion system F family protein [Anaerolineales bacterium]|nr:type II secretion system F family protein [Anaerolineales bacterium]MCX7755338.1 type II secretion system F family protein [Anaerolineales bacterium]MDW8279133.1 type II secretion system F family protein [Anaerolineales bacterium]